MRIEIITIGDEILIGQTIDTNSAWLGKILNENGLIVNRVTSISDTESDIISSLQDAFKRVDLVIMTGGLGPTKDDITKKVLAAFFEKPLERNQLVLKRIEEFFKARNRAMLEVNRQQADLPADTLILDNDLGTASGMWFKKGGKECISLPGVPYEMQGLISNQVLPRLNTNQNTVYHKHILTSGLGESFLADILKSWEDDVRSCGLSLAYLPTPGLVKLRISTYKASPGVIEQINTFAQQLPALLKENFIGFDVSSLSEAVLNLAKENKVTISFAESCTGGRVSADLVKLPGASDVLKGAIVAYANEIKTDVLKVNKKVLVKHGAVSEEVVLEMAKGVQSLVNTDFSVAISGIAGPDGGSEDKPVGTVCFSVATPTENSSKIRVFRGERAQVIQQAANYAFNYLIKSMLDYFNNQKKSC